MKRLFCFVFFVFFGSCFRDFFVLLMLRRQGRNMRGAGVKDSGSTTQRNSLVAWKGEEDSRNHCRQSPLSAESFVPGGEMMKNKANGQGDCLVTKMLRELLCTRSHTGLSKDSGECWKQRVSGSTCFSPSLQVGLLNV